MSIASYLSQLLNSSGLVPGAKIASGAIGLSQLTATGTPSGSNFLRGDNTWATVAGTGTVTSITAGTGLSGGTITTSGTIALVTTYAAVGTYAFLSRSTNQAITAGTSYAGSGLAPASVTSGGNTGGGSAPAGTWQAMGTGTPPTCASVATLFVRTV